MSQPARPQALFQRKPLLALKARRAKCCFVDTDGPAPPSPNTAQIPPVKHKTRVGWVIRRARIAGHPSGCLEATGDQPPQLKASPEATPRSAGERWTIALPSPQLTAPRSRTSVCGDRRRYARPGEGANRAAALSRFDWTPPPTTAAAEPRGPPSRAQLPGPRGGRQARSIAPPCPPLRAAQHLPPRPLLRAPGRLTVKLTNQRHVLPFSYPRGHSSPSPTVAVSSGG